MTFAGAIAEAWSVQLDDIVQSSDDGGTHPVIPVYVVVLVVGVKENEATTGVGVVAEDVLAYVVVLVVGVKESDKEEGWEVS